MRDIYHINWCRISSINRMFLHFVSVPGPMLTRIVLNKCLLKDSRNHVTESCVSTQCSWQGATRWTSALLADRPKRVALEQWSIKVQFNNSCGRQIVIQCKSCFVVHQTLDWHTYTGKLAHRYMPNRCTHMHTNLCDVILSDTQTGKHLRPTAWLFYLLYHDRRELRCCSGWRSQCN